MTQIPNNLKYTNTHEWIKLESDGSVKVGITEHAQSLLGDIVFVDLPQLDDELNQGDECAVVESVKAAADIYAPISGKIITVNAALSDSPQLVNEDSYGNGWIFTIEPDNKSELAALLSSIQYEQQLAAEH